MPISNRSDDEILLSWLAARAGGKTSVEVARDYGVTQERVRSATQRVRDADVKESREPREVVLAGYWGALRASRK